MKNVIISILSMLAAGFFVAVAIVCYHVDIGESAKQIILSQEKIIGFFFEDETIYSDSFKSENWNLIEKKQDGQNVERLLGKPLQKTTGTDGKIYWHYSKQGPKNTNYRMRIIVFDSNNKVETIVGEFYLD